MNRPKYKELYLEEKNKSSELKAVLKQYRVTFSKLIEKKILGFEVMKSQSSFNDLDVITAANNRSIYKYTIARESVEEDE